MTPHPIPTAAIGRLLLRLFPFHDDAKFAHQSLDDLRRRYFKWYVFCIAAYLALAGLVTWGLHEALVAYTQSDPHAPAVHELRPGGTFWWAPAAFLGCVLAGPLVGVLYRVLLRGRSDEYRHYVNLRTGLNVRPLLLALGLVLGTGSLALAWFAAQSRLIMTENELVIRRIFSLADERYPYSSIRGLREIHDRRKDNTIFVIQLAGAPDWSTKVEVIFPGDVEKAWLMRRSGRRIQRFEAG